MAEVKKVVIKVGEHEFEISIEEAKSLRDILNSTFPTKEKEYVPYPISPAIIYRSPSPLTPYWRYSDSVKRPIIYLSTKTGTERR